MTVVTDQVRRLDAQLDRIPFHLCPDDGAAFSSQNAVSELSSRRVSELLRIIRSLSTSSASQPILPAWRLHALLVQSKLDDQELQLAKNQHEAELEWLLVSKAAVQIYGHMMHTLLEQIIPLSDQIWYWDEVLASPTYSSLYMVQTSPWRLWTWSRDIYLDSKSRLHRLATGSGPGSGPGAVAESDVQMSAWTTTLSQRWRSFYAIVQESVRERSLANMQARIMTPVAICRAEARQKQAKLKKLREMTSSGLGVLINEGLAFGGTGSDDGKSDIIMSSNQEWKGVVERSVALMDMVLQDVLNLEIGVSDFEDKVFAGVEEDPELSTQLEEDDFTRPNVLASRLLALLNTQLRGHLAATHVLVAENGRPSGLVRYWLPATALLLSSTTIFRIILRRRQDIIKWVADFGATVRDFWLNWVVEPTRKVIGTIRHDSNSEIAIMSKESLKADQDSLERMVVDFAVDNPDMATGNSTQSSLSESQVAHIRAKVHEGDVTPILRAYEKDLKKPFAGAVRGDLVRTLLIQVQKTKVDVEVAMAGIDALLKSQELVFGFVGLTPGILVSIGLAQYLRGVFGGRQGYRRDRHAGKCVRVLRNIDRIFSDATPSANNLLSYKDHGLLVCEAHVLRQLAHNLLPGDVERDFVEDLDDVVNMKGTIQSQVRAFDRIRWAYSKWLKLK